MTKSKLASQTREDSLQTILPSEDEKLFTSGKSTLLKGGFRKTRITVDNGHTEEVIEDDGDGSKD